MVVRVGRRGWKRQFTHRHPTYVASHCTADRFVGYATGGHSCVDHQDEVVSAIVAFVTAAIGRLRHNRGTGPNREIGNDYFLFGLLAATSRPASVADRPEAVLRFEGIVAKRADSIYRAGRRPEWVKAKNPNYSRQVASRFGYE